MDETSTLKTVTKGALLKQQATIRHYYNFQSKIYDSTRWAFLFGRKEVVEQLPFLGFDQFVLVEIGSGTGYNLKNAAFHFPKAILIGMDVSEDMVKKSRKKLANVNSEVEIFHQPFDVDADNFNFKPNVILINYALTMMNPQWQSVIEKAREELPAGGYIAVADFHNSKHRLFKNHMAKHHVRMDGHLLPVLENLFEPKVNQVREAYGGLWEYFTFIGQKV